MFFQDLKKILRGNIREYGMFIALFIIPNASATCSFSSADSAPSNSSTQR